MANLYIYWAEASRQGGRTSGSPVKSQEFARHPDAVDTEGSGALLASIGQTEADVCSFMF